MSDNPDAVSQAITNSPGSIQQLTVGSGNHQCIGGPTPNKDDGQVSNALGKLVDTVDSANSVADGTGSLLKKIQPLFRKIVRLFSFY